MFKFIQAIMLARKGRAFGNEVADYFGMHRSIYHGAMEEGGCPLHLIQLASMKKGGDSVEMAAAFSCQFLLPGLVVLRERFGPQDHIAEAWRKVSQLVNGGY